MSQEINKMEIYEKYRAVPYEAKKTIGAGRLKGMTDINPMWRIKCLTDCFGPVGFGWYYDITEKWIETANDEATANVEIALYVKWNGEWSKPIKGIGGSKLIAKEGKKNEKPTFYVSDECFKMALTDAISVACKALGFGADVYWSQDATKYSPRPKGKPVEPETNELTYREKVKIVAQERNITLQELAKDYGLTKDTTEERFAEVLKDLEG